MESGGGDKLKTPNFKRFHRSDGSPLVVAMTEETANEYISYIDSPFTKSSKIFTSEKVSIIKYVCPIIRHTAYMFLTHVLIVASYNAEGRWNRLVIWGKVFWNTSDKYDDSMYRKLILLAISENWKIEIKKGVDKDVQHG